MKILITGGLGFIGSHTALTLLEAGYEIVLFDNFVNSDISTLERMELLSGKKIPFYEGDIRDKKAVNAILSDFDFEFVIHFAGLKSVSESQSNSIEYCDNNINGTINLISCMNEKNIRKLVFSSSATVYGNPDILPFQEDHPTNPTNVYGFTKLNIERICKKICETDTRWKVCALRYFNPTGAHESGLIGESPKGTPNNLMPRLIKSAFDENKNFTIFGSDYPTRDGTAIRDYIHISDVALGHLAAVESFEKLSKFETINLGTSSGVTVLELINCFCRTNKVDISRIFGPRRQGDIAEFYASNKKALELLNWQPTKTLEDMCRDSFKYEFTIRNEALSSQK